MINVLEAKTIGLRCVEVEDAEFIYTLRVNDKLNQFLSPISSGINSQKKWITQYKTRELAKNEFYFIIYRKDTNKNIGTVRLYDFIRPQNSFCWGSWILNEDKTPSAALESALLVYDFAFNELAFERAHFDVRKNNQNVINFHKKCGAQIINENELDIFFNYEKTSYANFRNKYVRFLNK